MTQNINEAKNMQSSQFLHLLVFNLSINQFWKKESTKNEKWKITILFYINRLWFRVPHGLFGAFIRHYTSRPLVLPYLRSLRPHKWLHLASTSTYWVSQGPLYIWTEHSNCQIHSMGVSKTPISLLIPNIFLIFFVKILLNAYKSWGHA